MNTQIWSVETAKTWGRSLAKIKSHHKDMRTMRRIRGAVSIYFTLLAASGAYHNHTVLPVMDMLVAWWAYRMYRNALRFERLWRECSHHGQRLLVETRKLSIEHIRKLKETLNKIG